MTTCPMIVLGRGLGFTFFQVNTNGLRLARDADYLRRLVDAGLTTVFLQFDGTCDEVHRALRGRAPRAQGGGDSPLCRGGGRARNRAPTLVPRVNTEEIGAIIEYALRFAPAVRGRGIFNRSAILAAIPWRRTTIGGSRFPKSSVPSPRRQAAPSVPRAFARREKRKRALCRFTRIL